MTGMPEAALARELGIPYAAINVVANYAAGRADSSQRICFDSIEVVLHEAMGRVRKVLDHLVERSPYIARFITDLKFTLS